MFDLCPSSVDRRFRVWEDVALDFPSDQYEVLPVVRRDVCNTTTVVLAALHHELSVDPLLWCADFAVEIHRHSSDAVYQQVQVDPNLFRRGDGRM